MKIDKKIGVVGNGFVGGYLVCNAHVVPRLEFMIRIQVNQHMD